MAYKRRLQKLLWILGSSVHIQGLSGAGLYLYERQSACSMLMYYLSKPVDVQPLKGSSQEHKMRWLEGCSSERASVPVPACTGIHLDYTEKGQGMDILTAQART